MNRDEVNNERKLIGSWWLPNFPESKVHGELHLKPFGESYLEIFYSSGSFEKDWPTKEFSELILGESINGEKITLKNSYLKSYNGFLKIQKVIFISQLIITGIHIDNLDQMRFENIYVNFGHLSRWIDEDVIELEYQDEKMIVSRFDNEFKTCFNNFDIVLQIYSSYSNQYGSSISINKAARFKISTKQKKDFTEFIDIISHIQNFLALALSFQINPTEIYFLMNNHEQINFYYELIDFDQEYEYPFFPLGLFRFSEIKETFSEKIESWLKFSTDYFPITSLYFSVLNNPFYYSQSVFLHFTQIIETYHRRKFKHEMTFKDRLLDILEYIEDQSINLLSLKFGIEGFAKRVKVTRNYFTHYDKNPDRDDISQGQLLIIDSNKLRGIIEIIFLMEIGFKSNFINGSPIISKLLNGISA